MTAIFFSHYPIDRYSLGGKWLKMIKGRDIMAEIAMDSPYREVQISFACLVYKEVDMTMHLLLLLLIARYLY